MIPLLAGVSPESMHGPQSVLNALSCETDGQLIQLVEDTGTRLGLRPQSASSYQPQIQELKTLASAGAASSVKAEPKDSDSRKLQKEIEILRRRNAELSRKPYLEALGKKAEILLSEMNAKGKLLLRYLLENEPLEVGRQFFSSISGEEQFQQMTLVMQAGVIRHHEVRVGSGALLRTDYELNPQYRPVLEDLLYRT
jgi:hypothetical protein